MGPITTLWLWYYISHSFAYGVSPFSDLVGFTSMSSVLHPSHIFRVLNAVFTQLDHASTFLNVWKYETVGDAYITVSNIVKHDRGELMSQRLVFHPCLPPSFISPPLRCPMLLSPSHILFISPTRQSCSPTESEITALTMGVTLIHVANRVVVEMPDGAPPLTLSARVGLNIGPLAGGIAGQKRQVLQLVGDALNTASRMESNSLPNHVQATELFWGRLPRQIQELFDRRELEIKGKGKMTTYIFDAIAKSTECSALGLNLTALMDLTKDTSA